MRRPYPHSLKILFYADSHVGDRANGRLYTDVLEAERFITALAIKRKVDWVVFGGDAFKSRNPHDEHKTRWIQVRADRSRDLAAEGIHEFDLVGNHCRWYKADSSGHVFEALGALPVITGHCHIIADTQSTWYSVDERVIFQALPAQVPFDENAWQLEHPDALQICVFHGMVKGCSLNQAGTVLASDGIPMEVLDRTEFDFVLGGDIHLPAMLDFKNTVGGYVGSTLQLDATDVGEKRGCMIITFVKGETEPQVEFIPVPQAELLQCTWDVSTPMPDLAPFKGHLLTLRLVNAGAISSVDLEIALIAFRQVARHLSVINESPGHGTAQREAGEAVVYDDPIEDFTEYASKIPGLDDARRSRIDIILRNEVFNAESA